MGDSATADQIAASLQAKPNSRPQNAAVQLLVEHGFWLQHPGFASVVDTERGEVNWREFAEQVQSGHWNASASDRAVALACCSIGDDVPISMRELMYLDATNVQRLQHALQYLTRT